MKENFKLLISDQFVRISLVLSLIFIIPLMTIIILSYAGLPPLVPFFNSMPWGEERLALSTFVIVLPLILFTVFTGNIIQAVSFYSKYVLVSRIVLFNCFLFLLLGLLAYLQILFLSL